VLSDFILMTTDVDFSKSKSLEVDSLLAAAAPNLSDSGLLAWRRHTMTFRPAHA